MHIVRKTVGFAISGSGLVAMLARLARGWGG